MNAGWSWLIFALSMTAVGQLVFKRASMNKSWRMTILAIACFCVVPPASYLALHTLTLATVYVSTALSQVVVVLASLFAFGERYSSRQWFALVLILAGVVVFNSSALL